MSKIDYQKALLAAQSDIQQLLAQRTDIDARIAQLKSTVEHLSALLQEVPKFDATLWGRISDTSEGLGITDAIRQILQEGKMPFTALQVREALQQSGLDMDYANTMAVIHNTLNRLEKQGEVVRFDNPSGTIYAARKIAKKEKFGGPPVGERT